MRELGRIIEQYSHYFETSFALYKQKQLIYGKPIESHPTEFMINNDYYRLCSEVALTDDQIQLMKIGLISILEINVPKTNIKDHFRNIVNNHATHDDISSVNEFLGSDKFYTLILIRAVIEYDLLYSVINNLVGKPVTMIYIEGNYLVCFKTNSNIDLLANEIQNTLETEIMIKNQVFYLNHFTNINDIHHKYIDLLNIKRLAHDYYQDYNVIKKENMTLCRIIDDVDVGIIRDILYDIGFNIGYRLEEIPDIQSIYCFMKNNLNIAETARELYIHRNTLIYRLERFTQVTNLDLRKFEDAMKFAIILMLQRSIAIRINN